MNIREKILNKIFPIKCDFYFYWADIPLKSFITAILYYIRARFFPKTLYDPIMERAYAEFYICSFLKRHKVPRLKLWWAKALYGVRIITRKKRWWR